MAAGKSFPLSLIITGQDRLTGVLGSIHRRLQSAVSQRTTSFAPLTNSFAALRQETGGIGGTLGVPRLAEQFRGVTTAVREVGDAVQTTARRIGVLTAGGAAAAFLFKRQFIDTASTFENLEVSLEAIEGGADKARAAMAFIKRMTVETPFELEDVARTFRTLRAQGLDPMNGTLQAIVDQVAKVGGSGDTLTHIAQQLGQAWGKSRLMAQDANILVENGIPVWAMLERASERMGKKIPVAQLRKMSEEGKLGTKVITLLMEQIGIESRGASKRMMSTWTGLTSNLADMWTFFKNRVMTSGPFDALKARARGLLDLLDRMERDGSLASLADDIGGRLVSSVDELARVTTTELVPAARTAWAWILRIKDAVGGWGAVMKIALAVWLGAPIVMAVFNLFNAVRLLTGGVMGVVTALGLAGPPAWALLLAVVALGGAVYVLWRNWGALTDLAKGFGMVIGGTVQDDIVKVGDGFALAADAGERLDRALGSIIDRFSSISRIGRVFDAVVNGTGLGSVARMSWADTFSLIRGGATGVPIGPLPNVSAPGLPRFQLGPPVGDNAAAVVRGAERDLNFQRQAQRGLGAPPQGEVKVTIDGRNMPAGARLNTQTRGDVALEVLRGLTMAESH